MNPQLVTILIWVACGAAVFLLLRKSRSIKTIPSPALTDLSGASDGQANAVRLYWRPG